MSNEEIGSLTSEEYYLLVEVGEIEVTPNNYV